MFHFHPAGGERGKRKERWPRVTEPFHFLIFSYEQLYVFVILYSVRIQSTPYCMPWLGVHSAPQSTIDQTCRKKTEGMGTDILSPARRLRDARGEPARRLLAHLEKVLERFF